MQQHTHAETHMMCDHDHADCEHRCDSMISDKELESLYVTLESVEPASCTTVVTAVADSDRHTTQKKHRSVVQ